MAPIFTGSRMGFGRVDVLSTSISLLYFKIILANFSSNNILIYDTLSDSFSSVTIGSAGQIYQLHNTSSGLVSIANDDGSNCTVYRSTNNGSSWSSISTVGFTQINLSKYTSKSGETIILNQNAYDPPSRRSTDGGGSWSGNITLPGFSSFGALGTASRSNGNWYYTGRYVGGYDVGSMWRSTDNGASWTQVATFNNDQTNGKVAYASNVGRYVAANYPYSTYTYQKPVYSSNGTSWTNPGNGTAGQNFAITHDVDASSTSYIGVSNNSGIYRSTDGLNWTSIDLSYLSGLSNNATVVYNSTLQYYFVLGPSYFLVSIDDGLTWIKKSTAISGNYSNTSPLILTS